MIKTYFLWQRYNHVNNCYPNLTLRCPQMLFPCFLLVNIYGTTVLQITISLRPDLLERNHMLATSFSASFSCLECLLSQVCYNA